MANSVAFSVYMHTCPNGRVYVGITKQKPKARWNCGYRHNPRFLNAINKYGWDSIKHEVLFTGLSKEDAEAKEIELIKKYRSNEREFGYNQTAGGGVNFGFHVSERGKMAISKAQKGRKRTPEQIEQMRQVRKGKPLSLETRKKLLGRIPWNKGKHGVQKPSEKQRIAAANAARLRGTHVICVETGEEFISLAEAARKIKNANEGNISRALRKNQRCGGYHWKRV